MNTVEYDNTVADALALMREHRGKLADMRIYLEAESKKCEAVESALKRLCSDVTVDIAPRQIPETACAIADGTALTKEKAEKLDQSKFDLIVDIDRHSLKARKDPSRRTALAECKLHDIGSQRLKIVATMAERPGSSVSIDDVELLFPRGVAEAGSLTKTMCVIRRALGADNPYLQTLPGKSALRRAGYRFDPRWKYLVIKRFFKSQSSVSSKARAQSEMSDNIRKDKVKKNKK